MKAIICSAVMTRCSMTASSTSLNMNITCVALDFQSVCVVVLLGAQINGLRCCVAVVAAGGGRV